MCVHAAVTDGTAQRTRCNAAQHVPSTTAHSLLGNGAQRVLSNAARGVLSNAASCVIPHTHRTILVNYTLMTCSARSPIVNEINHANNSTN